MSRATKVRITKKDSTKRKKTIHQIMALSRVPGYKLSHYGTCYDLKFTSPKIKVDRVVAGIMDEGYEVLYVDRRVPARFYGINTGHLQEVNMRIAHKIVVAPPEPKEPIQMPDPEGTKPGKGGKK